MTQRLSRALGALALMILASCSSDPLTQVMLVIDTDLKVPQEISAIRLEIQHPDATYTPFQQSFNEADLPLQVALVHRGGPLGVVRVSVNGLASADDETVLIQRRAEFTFVRGEVRELRIDLLKSCEGIVCERTESCAAEGCRPLLVTEDELAPWRGAARLDGGPEMDMSPDAGDGCVEDVERCDGVDNDCDGAVDEDDPDIDFQTDPGNCGGCGTACVGDPTNASLMCRGGVCTLVCDDGFDDCDTDEDNGCEADLATADTCLDCGTTCAGDTPVCDLDGCIGACPEGTYECSGTCANLATSVVHCKSCGNTCGSDTNASPYCGADGCALRCDAGYFDCDGSPGCETRLRDNTDCGACGNTCSGDNATTTCASGTCAIAMCTGTFQDCDGDPMTGCEVNAATSLLHCGACGNACPADPANAAPVCTAGACGLVCDAGYRDCNGDIADGCEVRLDSPTSCGSCGTVCGVTRPLCAARPDGSYACVADCDAGQTSCTNALGDTTCVDLTSDIGNCGGCGTTCAGALNATPTCSASTCGTSCETGFRDCDGDGTSCEATVPSLAHCGGCNMPCSPVSNATIACNAPNCVIAGCTGTYRNCDSMYANGCETDTATSVGNCGTCGRSCTAGANVAEVTCAAAACAIVDCEPGWADCDGDFATGCEIQLGTRDHCSTCGDRCQGPRGNRCCPDGTGGFACGNGADC
ncbi:MAG: hypothetical protein CMN30_22895 [Sandaracinus sp.]|nr:hypothetical protein [Sandaracinus sp.]